MTDSIVPRIYDPLEGRNKALVELREYAPPDSRNKATARSAVVPCVESLIQDFNNRWGSGKNPRGKAVPPQGFRPETLMVTVLDPRTKILYGTCGTERLCTIVSRWAAGIAAAMQAGHADGCSTRSSCYTLLNLQATQDRLHGSFHGSFHGACSQIAERFIASYISGHYGWTHRERGGSVQADAVFAVGRKKSSRTLKPTTYPCLPRSPACIGDSFVTGRFDRSDKVQLQKRGQCGAGRFA